jgi:hypothetical protein
MCHLADSLSPTHAYSYSEADFRVQGGQLALENGHSKAIIHQEHGRKAHSFDNLAMGLADDSLTRGQALKYAGAALLGGLAALAGISAFADDADARRRKKKRRRPTPDICPGQLICPPGFIGNAGCCSALFPLCCPANLGGGCCEAGFPICLPNGLCGRAASAGASTDDNPSNGNTAPRYHH